MRFFYLMVGILMSLPVWSQDSAKVLFIGNSYTYVNDLPQMVTDLAASLGDNVYHDDQALGGATFETHVNQPSTYAKIHAADWDFVVLQAQSQEPSFPDNQVNTNTLPFAEQLADSIYANYFCSEALFFMTWGREDGDPQWQPISTFDGMNARLRSAYIRMADSVQGSVSPVGSAWKYVRDTYPGIQLYSGDGSHPSAEGSYLAACTFYASIFRKSPVGASPLGAVDSLVAIQLQQAAEITVLDSLDFWNLRPISEHTQAEFAFSVNGNAVTFGNQSTKAQTYSWDFGDGQTSTDENPQITYAANGTYTVSLISESPCDSDTTTASVTISSLGISALSDDEIRIKTLGSGHFEVITETPLQRIVVRDSQGNVLFETETASVDLSACASGIYFLWIETEGSVFSSRVMR